MRMATAGSGPSIFLNGVSVVDTDVRYGKDRQGGDRRRRVPLRRGAASGRSRRLPDEGATARDGSGEQLDRPGFRQRSGDRRPVGQRRDGLDLRRLDRTPDACPGDGNEPHDAAGQGLAGVGHRTGSVDGDRDGRHLPRCKFQVESAS